MDACLVFDWSTTCSSFHLVSIFKCHLFTNVERCRIGLSEGPSCKFCGNVEESCIHVLQDYCNTKEAWE